MDLRQATLDFYQRAVARSGKRPGGLASKAGLSPSTLTRPLNNPDYSFTPKLQTLLAVAKASGEPLPAELREALEQDVPVPAGFTDLPLLSRIQAGAWLEIDDTRQDDPDHLTIPRDRRYPHASQWLRQVQGDSMNARGIMPGEIAHLVDFIEAGAELRSGMVVEVTRTRDGGLLREITLKEVEITSSGVLLWPRSTNPKWSDPVVLVEGEGDIEVAVTGLLLQTVRPFA